MPVLHWLTRDEDIATAQRVPYRLLEEVPKFSIGAADSGNMLIQGDNPEALKVCREASDREIWERRNNGKALFLIAEKTTHGMDARAQILEKIGV